jgi:methyl-accepting chemotaxis protein
MRSVGDMSQVQQQQSTVVTEAMNDLSGIAEQNAAATEQMAANIRETTQTVQELSRLAENLNALVARFKV